MSNKKSIGVAKAITEKVIAISFFSKPDEQVRNSMKRVPYKYREFNPETKDWIFEVNMDSAPILKDTCIKYSIACDNDAAKLLNVTAKEVEETISLSSAVGSAIDIPCPDGIDYFPFQKGGIAYAMNAMKRGVKGTLIGDDMGLGKTIQAIGIANTINNLKKVLVICPASVKFNWQREWYKWTTHKKTSVGVAEGDYFPTETTVVVVNYNILDRHKETIDSIEWDLLVVDECHYIKNPKTKRTQMVLGHSIWNKKTRQLDLVYEPIKAEHRVFMSGTPLINRPIELWPIAHSLDPEKFSSWKYFVTRYCEGYQGPHGWNVKGASNLEELQTVLRSRFMVRREKKDVLKELPDKLRQVIEFDIKGKDIDRLKAKEIELYEQMNKGDFSVAFDEIAKVRHELAVVKTPACIEHIDEVLESKDKLIVFAHHKDVIDALKEHYSGQCVAITGATPPNKRQGIVDQFQNDPDIKVFIGNIQAAGEGITLTVADMLIFCEFDWAPGKMQQCEDRAYRIGQKNSVLVQFLVLNDSMDMKLSKQLAEKEVVVDRTLNMSNITSIQSPQLEGVDVDSIVPAARIRVDRVKLKEGGKEVLISRVAESILFLAGMCNGAVTYDDVGFNKLDTNFGHSLARGIKVHGSLTEKQAIAALKMIQKYHRQLSMAGFEDVVVKEI